MSMIYECPNCHTPQASGRTACRHCGAEFDSAVPGDAFVPDGTAPEPSPPVPVVAAAPDPGPDGPAALEAERTGAIVYDAPASKEADPVAAGQIAVEPVAQEAAAEEAEPSPPQSDTLAPPLEAPPPSAAETLPYQSSPYPAPAYQAVPAHAGPADTAAPPPAPQRPSLDKTLTRALLIAFPIVLVLVLGAVFFSHSLDSGQDTAPTPLPAIVPTAASTSSGTPAAPPYVLSGAGASTGADEDPRTRRMVGRWESKKLNFFVFNENKTGTRGSLTGKGPPETFLWALVRNHLILYADKQEQLTYSKGPDEDTMFLRGPGGGKYVQYARTKTGPARP